MQKARTSKQALEQQLLEYCIVRRSKLNSNMTRTAVNVGLGNRMATTMLLDDVEKSPKEQSDLAQLKVKRYMYLRSMPNCNFQ